MKAITLSTIILLLTGIVTPLAAQENPLRITYPIGSFQVSTLSEGEQSGRSSLFIGATEEMLKRYTPEGTFPNAVNAFLIQTPGKTILVDAGFGRKLFDHLQALGVTPEQVDAVLLTHLHGDHIGGMLRDGKPAFPKADVYIAQAEYDYWMKSGFPSPACTSRSLQ